MWVRAVRARGIGLLRPLTNRDFRKLWAAMTVSMIGDGIYLVAIAWQVFQLSNSATALSTVFIAVTLPNLVFPLLGGVLTDRLDRRRVLIGADLVRMVAVAALGYLSMAETLELWHVVMVGLVFGIGDSFFLPAFGAIIPDLVPREGLVEANSLNQFMRPLAYRMIGPVLGGWTVATIGPAGAFYFDAFTFLVSAVIVAAISGRRTPMAQGERTSIASDMKEGFAYVRSTPWLWASFLATAIGLLAYFGPFEVLLPYIIRNEIMGGATGFGAVMFAGGVGAIIAAALISQLGMTPRPLLATYLCWGLGTGVMATYALATEVWHAMVTTCVMLALYTAGVIFWATIMQRLVPSNLLGRVSSFDFMVSSGLLPLSFALAGPLGDAIGATPTLIGAGLLGCAGVLIFLLVPGVRAVDHDPRVHDAVPVPEPLAPEERQAATASRER
ncbi:MAG: MFS transporter [Actinomycetota bacterium]